jgi:RimJ/RimL family protein N-acetyltransferase
MTHPSGIPEITTTRLRLRAFASSDIDAYAAMMSDPEVTRVLGDGRPLSRAEAWRQLAMFAGHWSLRGFGLWAVEEQTSGRFIGRIGCFQPEEWPGFEIAYALAKGVWRRGYAREGAGAALAFARETLGRKDIISLIRPANLASIRVAESLGAVQDGTIDFYGSPALVYRYGAAVA